MSVKTLPAKIDWQHWMERWDIQQSHHLAMREERFEIMLDAVATLCQPECIVLDLACGPGSISQRLLAQLPESQAIAVDYDPVLLKLGQEALGDVNGRLHWLKVDLNDPNWVVKIQETLARLGRTHLDAVLSSTAMHWRTTPRLIDVYREVAQLIRPGGCFLNADHMAFTPTLATFRNLSLQAREQRMEKGTHGVKSETFTQWWAAIETQWLAADPALQTLFDEHHSHYQVRDRSYGKALASLHLSALADAGFLEVDTIWQRYDNRVVLAIRG